MDYFFGYGSLVNIDSARETVGDTITSIEEALGVGQLPCYNFDLRQNHTHIVPRDARESLPYGLSDTLKDKETSKVAALNVIQSSPRSVCIGVTLKLATQEAINKICKREQYYDLKKLPCLILKKNKSEVTDIQVVNAYFFKLKPQYELDGTAKQLTPLKTYETVALKPYPNGTDKDLGEHPSYFSEAVRLKNLRYANGYSCATPELSQLGKPQKNPRILRSSVRLNK